MNIKVGVITQGPPMISKAANATLVDNLLIGKNFHWQKTIKAFLPGKVYFIDPKVSHHSTERNDGDKNDSIFLINELPIETYLQCVVCSEMNPQAPTEFMKAHAVISRSWALGKVLRTHAEGICLTQRDNNILIGWEDTHSHRGFHVCSDDHCQRYQGWQPVPEQTLTALKETEGEVLVDEDGCVADARFSKCCGGKTELFSTCWQDVDKSYLKSFDDPWCDLSNMPEMSRHVLLASILKDYDLTTQGYGRNWESIITKAKIKKNLMEIHGRSVGDIIKLTPLHRGPSGRIDVLRIEGTEGWLDIGKELWIRRLLSDSHLYSSAFEIEDKGETIRLIGRGWGHGVGLCQIGAANMAAAGYNYREILEFYYPGTRISRLEDHNKD